jgi:hypothetical protein
MRVRSGGGATGTRAWSGSTGGAGPTWASETQARGRAGASTGMECRCAQETECSAGIHPDASTILME